MCIENPFSKTKSSSFFRNLLSTHPSIEDRVKALENY
jgi:Zn-dependent protease with chaperone function